MLFDSIDLLALFGVYAGIISTSTVTPLRVARLGWLPKLQSAAMWCLASKWKHMPLAMKRQIKNQKAELPKHLEPTAGSTPKVVLLA